MKNMLVAKSSVYMCLICALEYISLHMSHLYGQFIGMGRGFDSHRGQAELFSLPGVPDAHSE
jgi:hypothetical protein